MQMYITYFNYMNSKCLFVIQTKKEIYKAVLFVEKCLSVNMIFFYSLHVNCKYYDLELTGAVYILC